MFYWTKNDGIVISLITLILILCAILLHFVLRSKKQKYRKIPLQIISVFIVLLEISKQIYYNCFEEFQYYILPVHFCSLFIILFPLSQLFGEKVGNIFKPVSILNAILMFVILLINPHSMLGSACDSVFGSFHNFHTIFFHFSVVAYLMFSIALNDYTPKKWDFLKVWGCVTFYATYAVPLAFALKTNYVNILYSSFEPFEKFRLFAGQVWYDIALFIVANLAMCLLFFLYYFSYKLINKLTSKKQKYAPIIY